MLTSMLCIKSKNTFIKEKVFNTPEEVVKYLDNKPLMVRNNFNYEESTHLKEAVSKRKRVYGSSINFEKIHFDEIIQISKEDEKRILSKYENKCKNIKGYNPSSKRIPMIVKANVYKSIYEYDENDGVKESINAELVFIDEGEGFVIDYIIYETTNKSEYYGGDQ